MDNRKKLLFLGTLFGAVILAGAAYYSYEYLVKSKSPQIIGAQRNVVDTLSAQNPAFKQAYNFDRADQPQQAITYYQQALSATNNTLDEEARIKYFIAKNLLSLGKIAEGISGLKEIVANTAYPTHIRAQSVEHMGISYYSEKNPEITKQIFSTSPYDTFVDKSGDIKKTYLNLFKYAASIYPSAVSELRIADYYAHEASTLSKNQILTQSEKGTIAEDLTTARDALAKADQDLNGRIADSSVGLQEEVMSTILTRKAQVLSWIRFATGETSGEDPATVFQQALNTADTNINQEGWTIYHYADYLAHEDPVGNKAKITDLLQNFYASDKFKNTSISGFFTTGNDDENSVGANKQLALLASIDPSFKQFLAAKYGRTF